METNILQQGRIYRLERVGPAQVVRCYIDGFEQLSKQEKIFAYYLSLAAIAGRDIAIDQHHQNALEVRDLFEGVYTHPQNIDNSLFGKISTYLKLFWINNGFYDNITLKKFVPECTFDEFSGACRTARENGADFNLHDESLETALGRLRRIIFDPEVDRTMTEKSPGNDWIQESGVNFYDRSLSLPEIDRWSKQGNEKYPINSSLARLNGTIHEEVWRAGSATVPPGKYADDLRAVIAQLEHALSYASSEYQLKTTHLLIQFLKSGNNDDFRAYNIHWVKDNSRIDFILGFIEVYLDPRNQKGEWEASVFYTNEVQTQLMHTLAGLAQYFEDKAPWSDDYKKNIKHSPLANVIDVIMQTGGTGPVSPVGVNLPNEQAIREQHGSKSILLHNIAEAIDKTSGQELVKEFAYDEEEIENHVRYGLMADNLHTALHEVIGHGSGKMHWRLADKNPSELLPGYYSTIEEARADLVALWNVFDEKLVEARIVRSHDECTAIGKTMYQQTVRASLTQLRIIGDHHQLEEDHMKGRQLIGQYIIRRSTAVAVEHRGGKTFYHIVDYEEARRSVGELLAELMRIKAEGDAVSAKQLIDTYGLKVDVTLRNEVQERTKHLNLPLYTGFVQPKLEPVMNSENKIEDIRVTYPSRLAEQMLEYSAFTRVLKRRSF